MKISTFEARAKKVGMRKNTIAYKELFALLNGDKEVSRPDISNRNTVSVYTSDMVFYAYLMGISIHKFNDAPKGGITGNCVVLTTEGKKQRF